MELLAIQLAIALAQAQVLELQIAMANIEPPAIVRTMQPVEAKVREYFADIPALIEVAKCESRFRHYDENGQTLKGEIDPRDRGVMQINEGYHLEESKRLGYDILTLEGNIGYARHLFGLRGLRDWMASSKCWAGPYIDRANGHMGQV